MLEISPAKVVHIIYQSREGGMGSANYTPSSAV